MLRILRFGSICSSLISFTLFAMAALAWFGPEIGMFRDPEHRLKIDPPRILLGDIKDGSETPVSFILSNRSSRPIRVLGMECFCTKWGCIKPTGLPVTIPSESRREVQFMLRAGSVHNYKFDTSIAFYLDSPSEPTLSLEIQGRVLEGREPQGSR